MISPMSVMAGAAQAVTGRGSGVSLRKETANATENGRTTLSSQDGTSAESTAEESIVPSGLAMKETFLTLLVAQIKNQNPLNPADGTEFLSQLAQFTQVEQLISIREELETMGQQNQALSAAANEISLR